MSAIFSYQFMQRALASGLFMAIACAVLGVFLVLKRESMIAHGLSHIAFGGVAIGLFFNLLPLATALPIAMGSALGIVKLREKAGLYEDTAIGILSSIGLAVGIILASVSGSFNVTLMSYLFGNILTISTLELWLCLVLAMVIIFIMALYYRELMFITLDPESAKTSGIKVGKLEGLLAVLTAVTVVLGMRIMGLLLITALLVIPSAAGLQIAKSFSQAILFSILVAIFSVFLGLLLAFFGDLPASGTIILFSSVFFLIFFVIRFIKTRYH